MADSGKLVQSPRHFLALSDLSAEELRKILDLASQMKKARGPRPKGAQDSDPALKDHVLGMVFEKPSTRTRVSFDIAIRQLGGSAVVLSASELQLGRGETVADTARVLSRYVDCLMMRTDQHSKLLELAAHADVPVINGLTDLGHPCQTLADIMTFEEHHGPLKGQTFTWVGDWNNLAASWLQAAVKLPVALRLSSPSGYAPPQDELAAARAAGANIEFVQDPQAAADGADCLMTDTWVSMNQTDREARLKVFPPFQVDQGLLARAKPGAPVLHCLPAHRGEEITDDVLDGPNSLVWDQAENRMHVQKAILRWCCGK